MIKTYWYEDKSIEVLYCPNEAGLRAMLKLHKIEHPDDTMAYCDTFGDEQPDKWGRLYLLTEFNLDSTIHECIHLASGIMASKGHKTLDLTTEHATELEEQFCELVANLVSLISEDRP